MTPEHPGSNQPTDSRAGLTDGSALVAALLDPLLDARTQPAGDHFDGVLAAALADGALSAELARELRFWQRASVHELTDHLRAVLPAVLPVALAAATSSAAEAGAATTAAAAAWHDRNLPAAAAPDLAAQGLSDIPDAQPVPEVVLSAPDEITLNTAPPGDDTESDPVTNPHLRRRLFVAGLTSTA